MVAISPFRRWRNMAVRLAATSAFVLVLVFWVEYGFGKPLPQVWHDALFGIVITLAIGSLAWNTMPRVAHRVWVFHPALRWALLIAAKLGCAAAGTLIASVVFYLFGAIPRNWIFLVFRENIMGTSTVTLLIGIPLTIHGVAKSRLQATELSLRTQQLERERAEKLAAEAQLAALASRVEPHFLFNTLNSISALIHDNPDQAETMIERLSSLLRSSLDAKEKIPLERELKLVSDYLEIQRTRLGERLRFEISSAPEAAGTVPPFSLQTLVENSLKHGGAGRTEGVAVRVDAARANGQLVVAVTDNGPGFDPDAMKAGHGLDNLQSRLRVIYGPDAALEFERGIGSMTVRLRVPAA